jgi:murein DD-endopeptidase MepM/ murein hydrolase activator NlpD
MGKPQYYYNPESCNYEQILLSGRQKARNVILYLVAVFIFTITVVETIGYYYPTIKEYQLSQENANLELQWKLLNQEVDIFNNLVEEFWIHDEEIRKILELDSLSPEIRMAGIGGTYSYSELLSKKLEFEKQIRIVYDKIDKIRAKMQIQDASFDTLMLYAHKRDEFWASIPAVQPVENKDLRRLSTVYGMRLNPVLKRWMPHKGLDFMGATGVPVFATGDGTVQLAQMTFGGFGNMVIVNHGYGYKTRYAHLDAFNIKYGDKVKRGEIIGFMGNSGRSAGTHLHYEVLKNGVQVNPIGFFERELDDEELATLLLNARRNNIPLD